jgi:SAM-dependent methyltransferase
MPVGKMVRRVLGPLERPAADAYRRAFIDLDSLARTLSRLPEPRSILEVGAGDGMVAARLARIWPRSRYLGIDLIEHLAGFYDGPPNWARFETRPASELVAAGCSFDLVLVVDVIHHVPRPQWTDFVDTCWRLVAPSGWLAIKDWTPSRTLGHAMCYAADRWVTGDRVNHASRAELLTLVGSDATVKLEASVPPRANNLLLVAQRPEIESDPTSGPRPSGEC